MTCLRRLSLLLWLSLPAYGSSAIEMELTAGLGGQAVVGLSSEIKIRLYAASTTAVELKIIDTNVSTTVPVTLAEQTEKLLWLAVTPSTKSPIQVRLLASSGEVIEKELFFEHRQTPITLISSSIQAYQVHNSHQQSSGIRPVIISPGNLPHKSQAYAGVLAVVTDAASLSSLSSDQYHAFGNYIGACNILLLSDASAVVLEDVRKLSGCGGRFIQSYQTLAQIPLLLTKLKSQRNAKLPSTQDMMSLQRETFQSRMVTSLSYYLSGYIILMALFYWRMNKTHYLLVLPVITACAGALVWNGNGSSQLLSWAETESGDIHSRVSSLLLVGGDRRGENRVTLAADIDLSNADRDTQQSHLRHIGQGSLRELSAQTQLLSPQVYQLSSVSRQVAPFTLQLKQGRPELVLQAESAIDRARLLWQGFTYDVPALTKGEVWQPNETQKKDSVSAEEKLLHRRLQFDAPALLLPFIPDQGVGADNIRNTGWLVIRHRPEQML